MFFRFFVDLRCDLNFGFLNFRVIKGVKSTLMHGFKL